MNQGWGTLLSLEYATLHTWRSSLDASKACPITHTHECEISNQKSVWNNCRLGRENRCQRCIFATLHVRHGPLKVDRSWLWFDHEEILTLQSLQNLNRIQRVSNKELKQVSTLTKKQRKCFNDVKFHWVELGLRLLSFAAPSPPGLSRSWPFTVQSMTSASSSNSWRSFRMVDGGASSVLLLFSIGISRTTFSRSDFHSQTKIRSSSPARNQKTESLIDGPRKWFIRRSVFLQKVRFLKDTNREARSVSFFDRAWLCVMQCSHCFASHKRSSDPKI